MRDYATGTWVIHLAQKITGPHGEFLGVISAALELHYLQNYFRDISPNPNSSFALFRDDGMLLARYPDTDSDIGRLFPNALALKLVTTSDHGVGTSRGCDRRFGSAGRRAPGQQVSDRRQCDAHHLRHSRSLAENGRRILRAR